jgi:heptosyltransferase-3
MIMFKNINKILVIKLRHIGDVLLTVPAIRALKDSFPGATVSVLVNKGTEDVLAGNPLVDEIITFERGIKDLPRLKRLSREAGFLIKLRSRGFDMTVDLTGGDRAAVVSLITGARHRLGWKSVKGFTGKRYIYTDSVEPEGGRHTVLQNMDIVMNSGISTKDLSVDFHLPQKDEKIIAERFKMADINKGDTIVHIHPVSRWLFKCWKDEYMAEVICWLIDKGIKVVLTSGSDEKELRKAEKILSLCPSPVTRHPLQLLNLSGETNIKQLGAVSGMSDLFFGVDSAPMHIAAAVNTPVVALFGPSGAFNWGPWDNSQGSGVRSQESELKPYNRRNGLQSFGKHTVIQKSDDCIPCGKDGCGGSKKSRCLEEITPDEVKAVLSEKLANIRQ